MAVYFLNMKTFGRSNGSSATSAIAYRAGERIRDERTGKVFDHSARTDVMHKEIVLPERLADSDMSWAKQRESLWNAVETAETRVNSRVAREFLVALPAELTPEQRLGLVRGFSQELADRYRFVVDFAIHAPRTDPRNFHAHLLTSTREITSTGFGPKTTLELSDGTRRERGLEPFVQELVATRERWAALTNASLAAAQIAARVDHRSLAAQGIDREPALRLPRPLYEMDRRGEANALVERMRAEHQSRVAARVAAASQSVGRERAAHESPDARDEPTLRAPVTAVAQPAASPSERRAPPSLEDIRRQARENWLKLREQAGAAPARTTPVRTRDEDFSR
jgi:ATP-dependent exoDNAse (exonuclease V) alpha subunit